MPMHTCRCKSMGKFDIIMSMGNLVNMPSVHVSMYVYMCRHVYVCGHDCFMYVHMCIYCVCMLFMTMYSGVRIPLVSNCAV